MANLFQFLNFFDLTSTSAASNSTGSGKSGSVNNKSNSGISFDDLVARYTGKSDRNDGNPNAIRTVRADRPRGGNTVRINRISTTRDVTRDVRDTSAKVASSVSGNNNNVQAQVQAQAANAAQTADTSAPDASDDKNNNANANALDLAQVFNDIQELAEDVLSQLSPENLTKLQSFVSQVAAQFSQLQSSQSGDKLNLDLAGLREQAAELIRDLSDELNENTVQDLQGHLLTALDDLDAISKEYPILDHLADLVASISDSKKNASDDKMTLSDAKIQPLSPSSSESDDTNAAESANATDVAEGDDADTLELNTDTGKLHTSVPTATDEHDDDDKNDDDTVTDKDTVSQPVDMLAENPIADKAVDLAGLANNTTDNALDIDANGSNRNAMNVMQAFEALLERRTLRANAEAGANTSVTQDQNAASSSSAIAAPAEVSADNSDENANANDGFDTGTGASGQSSLNRAKDRANTVNSKTDGDELADGTLERPKDIKNDFQTFFEGILSARKFASSESQAPLNLQQDPGYDYTESETLRVGLTNVVRFVRAQGEQRASVIVEPPALGRITVELSTTTSGVEASVKVANEQVRQLVQDQVVQLRMSLEQQGVQLAHFTVDVQQDTAQQQQGGGQEQREQGRGVSRVGKLDDDSDDVQEEFRIDLEQGLLYWIA